MMAAESTRRSKPPVRRVFTDDLAVIVDGETYYPHAGEWVEFRRRLSWDFHLRLMRLQRLQSADLEHLAPEEVEQLEQLATAMVGEVARLIHAWSWTDADGQPLPPPTAEVIAGLEPEEIWWLMVHAAAPLGEAERKNV